MNSITLLTDITLPVIPFWDPEFNRMTALTAKFHVVLPVLINDRLIVEMKEFPHSEDFSALPAR